MSVQFHHGKFMDRVIKAAAVVVALGVLGTALNNFGMLPVLSKEFRKYTHKQSILAVQVYTNKYRSLIILPAPKDPVVWRYWQDDIEEARRERLEAEKYKIEFSK